MSALETAAVVVHLLFAVLWIGAVVFVAVGVLPLARDATLGPEPLESIVGRVLALSRAAALFLFASGLYLLYDYYLGEDLDPAPVLETGRGHLVLTMLVLWVAIVAAVEIGSSRLRAGLDEDKLREPAHEALPWFRGAAVLGIGVVVIGGLLSAGIGL